MQQFGRDRVESGHRADIVDQSKMTHLRHQRPKYGVMRKRTFALECGRLLGPFEIFGNVHSLAAV
jgi:hypothetical protein